MKTTNQMKTMNGIKVTSFILFITFISCTKPTSQEEQATTQSSPNITQVAVVEAVAQPFALQLLSNGRVSAQGRASLQFKVSGMIERIAVSNGQSVSAGALLAVLDNSAQAVAVEQAQVQLKEARLELNKLLIEYGGEDQDSSSVRPRIWEAVKTKSGFYRAVANLRSARLQLDNTILRAPYGGVVANLKTKAHNTGLGQVALRYGFARKPATTRHRRGPQSRRKGNRRGQHEFGA